MVLNRETMVFLEVEISNRFRFISRLDRGEGKLRGTQQLSVINTVSQPSSYYYEICVSIYCAGDTDATTTVDDLLK